MVTSAALLLLGEGAGARVGEEAMAVVMVVGGTVVGGVGVAAVGAEVLIVVGAMVVGGGGARGGGAVGLSADTTEDSVNPTTRGGVREEEKS